MCNLPTKPVATEAIGLMESRFFHPLLSNMLTLFLKYALTIPETVRNTLGSSNEEREMILLKAFEVTKAIIVYTALSRTRVFRMGAVLLGLF